MINKSAVISIMQESFAGLYASGIIDENIELTGETPIFGGKSILDSMAFVAFITDVEDAINKIEKKEIFVVLSDIEDLFPDLPILTADMLAIYLISICE